MTSTVPKRGMKRITVKPTKCPNPLFEKWLEEWKKEAASKGSDLQYCFGKALNSLRKYPLPLKTGRECGILSCFGNRLCIMLDRRLSEYKKEHPEGLEELSNDELPVVQQAASKTSTTPKKRKTNNTEKKTGSGKKAKTYLPAWRSGPYAILLTLLQESQKPNYPGHLTKTEIQSKAQPLCDTLFKRPEPGSYYTAWSSMAGLVKRGLVLRQGCPAKFSLSDDGVLMAMKLENVDNTSTSGAAMCVDPDSDTDDTITHATKRKTTAAIPKARGKRKVNNTSSSASTYGAAMCVDPDSDTDDREDRMMNVTKRKTTAISKTKGKQKVTKQKDHSNSQTTISCDDVICVDSDSDSNGCNSTTADTRNCHTSAAISEMKANKQSSTTDIVPPSPSKGQCPSPPPQQQDIADDTVILTPGSFDVVLLVDKKEISGRTGLKHLSEDATVAELSATGALFELRHLKVGDFAWVCRHRTTGCELVLPYIVERKRMDDLASSIRDGRFHEQKFRLKQSGVQHLIYLVESHGDNTHTILPLETLSQATINTQVVDGFTIKSTSSHRQSMRYLATMTRLLTTSYRDKTVMGCRQENLSHYHISDDLVSLMTFQEFNSSSSKTKALNAKDMFMKQLLQLHGLSVEKAQAITELYPTPRILMAAFQENNTAGEKLLATIRYGPQKRMLGPAISKTIHQFYTNRILS